MVSLPRDDHSWRIGTDAEVVWIIGGTTTGLTVTSAIPPVFDAYATVVIPNTAERWERHDRAMLALLSERSADRPWWLGCLETAVDDFDLSRRAQGDLVRGVALRTRRGGAATGRCVAAERSRGPLAALLARPNLPCRLLLARL